MVKMVIFFKRKPGMPVEAFRQHWRATHAPIIVDLPGLRRYVQNYPLESSYRKGEPPFDAVAESSFDDTQAMKALARSPQYQAVLADEPNFIDRASMGSIITDEHVIKEGAAPEGALKTIDLLVRKSGMPVDEFFAYWRDRHGPLCAQAPAFLRYVQNHTRGSIYASGGTPAYDGAAMSWFADLPALRAAASTEEFARLRTDVEQFVARDKSPSLLVQERVVLEKR